jgi:FkbM family methyltransferase
MNFSGLLKRFEPLALKVSGRLPLCPWRSVFYPLDPRTAGVHPPAMGIEVVAEDTAFKKLCFAGKHQAWFPLAARVNAELWSEYLSVFWAHPANAHHYLSHGTPISPGDVVIDGGCCEGFFVHQALEAGAARVIGIEPNPGMVQCLEKTFAPEIATGRVTIVSAALGAFRGRAAFSFDAEYPAFGQIGGGGTANGEGVTVETLAGICERLELAQVDFVKLDIEGAEIHAMEGALPVLKKLHPKLALTTYHREFDFACLKAVLVAAGYWSIRPVGCTQFGQSKRFRPAMVHARS